MLKARKLFGGIVFKRNFGTITVQKELEKLPVDIVLCRHGESEGNLAQRHSRKGNQSFWSSDFSKRHTSSYRLTSRGREHAKIAGDWIKKNISQKFDRYYTSEYVRALETAVLLDFQDSLWMKEFYLHEKDKGILGGLSDFQRKLKFSEELERLKREPFFVAPPGGESMAQICLRVDRVLSSWRKREDKHAESSKLIAVCHGNLMMAFRVRLEKLSTRQFQQIENSDNQHDSLHFCQILHYTRKNPKTGEIAPIPMWMRSICPWDLTRSSNEWREIKRQLYTNEDLKKEIEPIQQLVDEKLD